MRDGAQAGAGRPGSGASFTASPQPDTSDVFGRQTGPFLKLRVKCPERNT